MNFFVDFFVNNFQDCVWLAIVLVSLLPTLESKIAIPLAMNSVFWGDKALSPFSALLISFLGSILPCIFLMLLTRKLKRKTTGFFSSKILERYKSKSLKLETENSHFKKYLLLCCFISIPLPFTGVWTCSIVAGLSNLDIKYCFISILIGAFLSSSATTILCTLFSNSLSYILIISILIIIIFLFTEFLLSCIKKRNH